MSLGRAIHAALSLAGTTAVLVALTGHGHDLDGAPRIRTEQAAKNSVAPDPEDVVAAAAVRATSVNPGPKRSHTDAYSSVSVGRLAPSGYRVVNVVTVDWRNDRGARHPSTRMLLESEAPDGVGRVAGPCNFYGCIGPCPGECSFDIHCDDANPCTIDRCDIVPGTGYCTGTCVHDPVADNALGGCDNGLFCDGKETCQGAVCMIATAPHVLGEPCDSHASCGEAGTCDMGTHLCIAGNVGEACGAHVDCAVVGRCSGGPRNSLFCDSNADCTPGTCDIKGRCQPGTCTNGTPAICCSDPANPTICAEYLLRCSANSGLAGAACGTDTDCPGGACERCQPVCDIDADCNDGRRCNGVETCRRRCVGGPTPGIVCTIDAQCGSGGACLGQCHPGVNPCGAEARCGEKKCSLTLPTIYCLLDSDCPVGETCIDLPGVCNQTTHVCSPPSPSAGAPCVTDSECKVKCFAGRCCEPGAAELTCSIKTLAQCDAVAGNALFYSGDSGEQLSTDPCGGEDPLSYDEWGCPKYGSGLSQLNAANPPVYPVTVGPVSDASICVAGPGGPGNNGTGGNCLADPDGPTGALNKMGDDYTVSNGSYIGLDVMRWVGGLLNEGAISIEFYDANGVFVEDIVLTSLRVGIGIQVVVFNPSLVIPPWGYVVMRAASDSSPNTRLVWLSTNAAGGIGTNDPDALWINYYPGFPSSVNNNFLKMCNGGPRANEACVGRCVGGGDAGEACQSGATCLSSNCNLNAECPGGTCGAAPGILAFELVGDKVPDPIGACCSPSTGDCVDGVRSWVCADQGNIYHGDGSLCTACNGGFQAGNPCRKCVGGGPAGLCTSDAFCSPGFCEPNNPTCTGPNFCYFNGVPSPNQPCPGGVGDCSGPSPTCGPPQCVAQPACAKGACCNPDPTPPLYDDLCSLTVSSAACTAKYSGGMFQGFGTDCDADTGYDEAQQHCCRIPQYTDKRCMGGLNNLDPCTVDADCRFCVDGSHAGEACTTTSAAEPNGCLNEGVCKSETCVGGLPPNPNVCTTDADCPDNSGVCRGRCVERGTGGDSCEDAFIHVITVPDLIEGPKTITISGDNSPATSTEDEPDGCFGPMVLANDDPGWFEAFIIDKCARVRIDFCCSDPHRQPAYTLLYPDDLDDCNCQDPIPLAPDPYVFGQAGFGGGRPYCDLDNVWFTFPLLPAGRYYYPVYSALAGAHGQYQMHITVEACPDAACCYLACSIGGQYCDNSTPCPGGDGTCESRCEVLGKGDCDERQGYFLAPPNIPATVALCTGSPCATGSCCIGPGTCLDQVSENDQTPMTSAICDEAAFNGIFVGGVRCKGGYCLGGADDNESCSDVPPGQCANPGTCVGSAQQLAQANPCPVCTIEGSGNCQAWVNSPQMTPSDLGTGSGTKMADDFVLATSGDVTDVCVWGTYVETDLTTGATDCGGAETPDDQRADNFRVRVYEDDGGKPGGGNCTNNPSQRCFLNICPTGGTCLLAPLGESTCTRTKAVIPGAASEGAVWGGKTWSFQLSLDNPITGLVADTCYWLEVTNNTPDAVFGEKCTWHWSQLAANSTQGNLYSAAGSETNGYGAGSQRAWDMAWCLNLSVEPGGCASQPRACCTCTGSCTTATLNDCDDANGVWHDDVQACPPDAGCVRPPNDDCGDALTVPVGLYPVTTHCATTDGGNPVGGRADTSFQQDVWYFFRPIEDCPLRVDGCTSSQNVFDSVIAIYHDASNPTQCVCPLTQATSDRTLVDASNDDCAILGSETGGIVETDALAGHCYTIRFAGVPGNHQVGRSAVEISCGPPICGDQRRNGAEQCDGLDNANCRTANPSTLCKPDCTCGAPNPCGDGNLDTGEECDPGSPGVPCPAPLGVSGCRQAGEPLQCTCVPYCSNNLDEAGEECDGIDDVACPGRCRTSEAQPVCQCPPLVCGNGRLEESAGEECEFGVCTVLSGIRRCSLSPFATCTSDAECAPGTCLNADACSVTAQCASGPCNLATDRGDCAAGACRTRNDPLGGCTCACSRCDAYIGGNALLSCDDADDTLHCQGTACGALYPRALNRLYERSNSSGKGGILTIGVNGGAASLAFDSWNNPANGGPGASVNNLTLPTSIESVDFANYKLIYIPSDGVNTFGGIDETQMAALNTRRDDIECFVNSLGGSLLALTEAGLSNGWDWLPLRLVVNPPEFENVFPTAAMADIAPDATAVNMSHCCYHCIFTGPPGFSGLGVLARRLEEGQEPVILGGFGVTLTSENCNNGIDDDGDGLVDCDDPECDRSPNCFESNCRNNIDDDNDGFVDCSDPDCTGDPFCTISSPTVTWDPNDAHTRSLTFSVQPPSVATGTAGQSAIKITMVDLAHPLPKNTPASVTRRCSASLDLCIGTGQGNCPAGQTCNLYNFSAYDTRSNGVCVGGSHAGHHCDIDADCRVCVSGATSVLHRPCTSNADCGGGAGSCPAGGTCSSLVACTAAGEAVPADASGQGGCARWVGEPHTFLESQDLPALGDYRAARLQCTPYYHDWVTETAGGPITVNGAEILPSSTYSVQAYGESCKGSEISCTNVSAAVEMFTRRYGDVVGAFNPPTINAQQPDGSDVNRLVDKFRNQPGAPPKAISLIQPNLPELNGDVSGSDITRCVDAFRQIEYRFLGPCPCPSAAVCGALACPSSATVCTQSALPGLGRDATCVRTCTGGDNDGDPCVNNSHCPGGGTCGNPFCRDRCGRCD